MKRVDFIEECRSGSLDGVLAAYRTFPSYNMTGQFDEELLSVLPKPWHFLSHCGAGYDQIDLAACSAREPPLLLSNVPKPVNDATADTSIFLMLGALRAFTQPTNALRSGQWRGTPAPPPCQDLEGETLGNLGMGGIGRNMNRKAEVFCMKIIYHNRHRLSNDLTDGAKHVSFEDLLEH